MRTITTAQGCTAMVSDVDYAYLRQFTWHRSKKGYYYCRSGVLRGKRMHRVVAARAGKNMANQIDHKNLNKDDNRRRNLRPATNGLNRANSKLNANNLSGFKGVHRRKSRPLPVGRKIRSDRRENIWIAQINVDGRKVHLGQFESPEQAHAAYVAASLKHFGNFARA